MILDRASERVADWVGGILWLARVRRRIEAAAARWRPLRVVLATLAAVTRNDAQQLIAGIAYYGMVALIPVSVALLQFFGLALGQELSMGWFDAWSSRLLPGDIDLEGLLITEDSTVVGITGVFALLGLVWGSYKLFGSVGVVVNRMWGIAPAQVGIFGKTRQYLLMSATSLALLLSSVFTYLISYGLSSQTSRRPDPTVPSDVIATFVTQGWWSNVFAGLLSVVAFLIVYRYVPEHRVLWRWAIIGAGVAGVALQAVNYGVALFISYAAPSHLVYGPLASVLIVLVWLFASSVTLASGAAVAAYGQNVYNHDGPTPGPGWFLR
jgi:membrane protein